MRRPARPPASACDILLLAFDSNDNLSVRSLAAFLIHNGVGTQIEDCRESRKDAILRRIRQGRPKIVGFSIAFQAMLEEFADIIAFLRGHGVKSHFTAGGHIPTIAASSIFELVPGLDTAIRHEGEHTLLELYRNLENPDCWPGIRGLIYRSRGTVCVAPTRPLVADLDSLPSPVRTETFQTTHGLKVCSMLASRGCSYNCSFCSIRQYYSDAVGRRHRLRSRNAVAEEIGQLFKKGVRIFIFDDDDLGTRRQSGRLWVEQFATELERRRLSDRILWSMFCRVDEVDMQFLARLKQCGLAFVCMGIESGNEQGLKTLNKGFRVKDVFRAVDTLESLGLFFEYGFMMFDPDSTFESVDANLAFLEQLCRGGRVPVRFTKMVPLMGTPIARRLRETGRLAGTITAPNYTFRDNRLDLLELCWANAFGGIAFNRTGLVDRLRSARKDAVISAKFFRAGSNAAAYAAAVRRLTNAFNESAFETMHKAADFIKSHCYEDVLYGWELLEMLCEQERQTQRHLLAALDKLPLPTSRLRNRAVCS